MFYLTDKSWYNNGIKIKYITSNGYEEYYNSKGQLHRTDGPAIVAALGSDKYYLNGKELKKCPNYILKWQEKIDTVGEKN